MITGDSRSLRKCRVTTVARGATRSLFACVSRGLPGHLRCGISTSPKAQIKCSDFKHVVACLLAVGCRLSQEEVKNLLQLQREKQILYFPQTSGISHSFSLQISMVVKWDRPTNYSLKGLVQHVVYLLNATTIQISVRKCRQHSSSCIGEGTWVGPIIIL